MLDVGKAVVEVTLTRGAETKTAMVHTRFATSARSRVVQELVDMVSGPVVYLSFSGSDGAPAGSPVPVVSRRGSAYGSSSSTGVLGRLEELLEYAESRHYGIRATGSDRKPWKVEFASRDEVPEALDSTPDAETFGPVQWQARPNAAHAAPTLRKTF